MTVAQAEKDKEGRWWVASSAFPSGVHRCQSLAVASEISSALNVAYEMGKENKRHEIADAHAKFEELLRPPLLDYYADEEAA